MRKLKDFDLSNKKVFLRVDLNVPVQNGKILDETRINKIIPTINYLLENNARIVIASHFGRPKQGFEAKYSLEFLASVLADKLKKEVIFCENLEKANQALQTNKIILLENLRFHPGETSNDSNFAKELASIADFYVNDAFSCSHRAHASITKITEFLPSAAGLLLEEELDNLNRILSQPKKPLMAIIGGSKISTKLNLLNNLITKVDYLVIAGAMANSFLKAEGHEIGTSFYEPELLETAKTILSNKNCNIILPSDVVVAAKITSFEKNYIVDIKNTPSDKMILDIGPDTCTKIIELLKKCETVIINGPLGVFENFPFSCGTISIVRAIAKYTNSGELVSVAGGGDIVAAISNSGLFNQFSYISTAGGAFLEWLEGKTLPGIEVLGS
ncbi:MAG: phosphoglycerate kinase [Pseudomonadota bacterium]